MAYKWDIMQEEWNVNLLMTKICKTAYLAIELWLNRYQNTLSTFNEMVTR